MSQPHDRSRNAPPGSGGGRAPAGRDPAGEGRSEGGRFPPSRVPPPEHFPFAFAALLRPAALAFGVAPNTAGVAVTADRLVVRFGPWRMSTTLANIKAAEITGPYQPWKVAGGIRLSMADSGITFATNAERGLCVRFHDRVPAALPVPLLRHEAATMTVAEPDRLLAVLTARAGL